jgi:mRNA-degrading endonuclease RelE of RelBE toxin-antitoxin system
MRLEYEPRAVRALKKLGTRDRAAIVDALEAFVAGRLPNADVRKLHAVTPPTWRLRVGNLRALYRRPGDTMVVVDVEDRKDVYRG